MSGTRFKPGQSGNPNGRPRKLRRPDISAFEIVLDKRMTATIGGIERGLTVEEVLQQQTLRDALAGKRMAIRKVLKMIEKRETALAKKNGASANSKITIERHHHADNANEAMRKASGDIVLVPIDSAPHFILLTSPDDFKRVVQEFLKKK